MTIRKLNALKKIINNLNVVESETEMERVLDELCTVSRPTIVSFINAHAVNLAWNDHLFAETLSCSNYLFRDGSGMKILMNNLAIRPGINANGTDLIPRILTRHCKPSVSHKSIALFGTQSPFIEKARDHVENQQGQVIVYDDGFKELDHYVKLVKTHQPDLILLGMGMPRQEMLSQRLIRELDYPCLIVNGGAIFDFWAEKVRRAPDFFRRFGLEWVYRLFQEPKRLAKRYLWGNMVFLWRLPAIKKYITAENG